MQGLSHCSKSSFFVQKFNFDFPRKIVELFCVKTGENAAVSDFLAVDNFDFTRKLFCQNWIFGQKFDFSKSVPVVFSRLFKL